MTEAELLREVLQLCGEHSVVAFHSADSRRDHGKGYPDLTLVGLGAVMWVELKTEYGKLSPEQIVWRYRIVAAGLPCVVWRPSDLRDGTIRAALEQLSEDPRDINW